jgi:hypothetical protein
MDDNSSEAEVPKTQEEAGPKASAKKSKEPSTRKTGKKKAAKKSASGKPSSKRSFSGPRPFPAETLENAIKVPKVIKELNGGNPWPPNDVANALGMKLATNSFYYLTAGARDYGLTSGSRETEQITLNTIGRDLVYAPSPEAERNAIKRAFFNVELFKKVYEYYQGGALPELKYLQNTLESIFGIQPKYHEEFFRIYTNNCKFLETYGIAANTEQAHDGAQAGQIPHSIIVGSPTSKNSLAAFVAMPFSEKTERYSKGFFNEVLKNLITPAGIDAGFKVETAHREGSDIIHSTIVNDLLDADLVIIDLTEHNPNVLFELGLRMATERPICLLKAKGTPAIFDVDNLLRVVEYDPNLWKSTLEEDIPKLASHIKGSWENREANPSYMQILKRRS